MAAPILFVALPLAAAPLLYLLRRWRRVGTVLAAGLALCLTLLALGLPLDQPLALLGGTIIRSSMTVLGRAFEIDPVDRLALAFVFSQAAALFLGAGLHGAGRYYLPAGQAILGLLAAAAFVRPFLFAALFLEIAAALAVFMLGDEARPVTRGALRFLVFMTLGMPFILLTGWLIEGSAASPEDVSFVAKATLLLAAGFAVLLAVAPFHTWLPAVAEHSPPLAAAFVFTVMSFIPLFLLLSFLGAYTWLGQNPAVYRALTVAGGGMALVGALFAFGQRNFRRSMGYAMMVDIGAVLLAIGLGTPAGAEAALGALALRGLALSLWGVSLDQLRRAGGGDDDFDALRGLARRYPFASTALILSLLSLVGFPLTAGFPARWALLRLLTQIHPTGAILLLLGMVSVALVCVRGLGALLAPVESGDEDLELAPRWSEKPSAVVVYSLGVLAVLVLGAFPQWLLPLVARTASVFTGISQ
ncbi:MAG TPA: proton-conducting transporter membrane subunit [Anaerolineales bacterium]|nr:proton-conducting transporter membrane subunit [Anaerolineales bacterium]